MTQKRGDHMNRGVAVQMFGREHPAATVRVEQQRGAVRPSGTSGDREVMQAIANGPGREGAGMTDALQQIGEPTVTRSFRRCPVGHRPGRRRWYLEGLDVVDHSAMTWPSPSPIGMTLARSYLDGLICSR
jgi:hypothetical protein